MREQTLIPFIFLGDTLQFFTDLRNRYGCVIFQYEILYPNLELDLVTSAMRNDTEVFFSKYSELLELKLSYRFRENLIIGNNNDSVSFVMPQK